MSVHLNRFLTPEEKEALDQASIDAGFYRSNPAFLTPGMGWFQPCYFDPANPNARDEDEGGIYPCARGNPFLSIHYWQTWASVRPPICIVGPNGKHWEIDRKSSNGSGWTVTGEWPNLTCSPSIVLDGYHGFLRDGEFTPDVEGRGPVGIPYVQPKRADA